MDFETHVDVDGGDATNNQSGEGIATDISAPIGIENEANTSSTPKPICIPIPTQRQVNMDFKTHVNADGWDATKNQVGE